MVTTGSLTSDALSCVCRFGCAHHYESATLRVAAADRL
eukprot:COSAG01_NODE_68393_length_264_cov_0.630303_1_plen_37_part_01